MKTHGAAQFGQLVDKNMAQSRFLEGLQKRGIAIPSLYAIGGKSCARGCNLNQRSRRSDFEALVQACEELGVEHEARTGHKAVQYVKIRRGGTTMMMGARQELLKRSPEE
jgi:hypothetical protein